MECHQKYDGTALEHMTIPILGLDVYESVLRTVGEIEADVVGSTIRFRYQD